MLSKMKKNVNEKKRLKLHAENRNNVVSELQRAYVKYSSELGCSIIITFINKF